MLFGEHNPTIDSQCRISIPAKFRSELGEQFIIVRHLKTACLRIYSQTAWDAYIASLKGQLQRGSFEKVLYAYYRKAVQAMPDSLGRVRIPKELWEEIGVALDDGEKKDVVIIGCGEYGEIWAKNNLDSFDADLDLDQLSAEIERCGI